MLKEQTLNRINEMLNANDQMTTEQFAECADELFDNSGVGSVYVGQWRESNFDPSDAAPINLTAILTLLTKKAPTQTTNQLNDPEKVTNLLIAIDDGSLRGEIADICEAHYLLKWLTNFKEVANAIVCVPPAP